MVFVVAYFDAKILQMKGIPLLNLDLRTPLLYEKIPSIPEEMTKNDEYLLCIELDRNQSRIFEPKPEYFLGLQLFSGRKNENTTDHLDGKVQLPAGRYLFMQEKRILNSIEWLEMAIEQQKDGLWERHKMENLLYVRFLYEDNHYVTQLFRPVKV